MALTTGGGIIWQGTRGGANEGQLYNQKLPWLGGLTNARVSALSITLAGYTNCARRAYTSINKTTLVATVTGDLNLKVKAIMYFKCITNGKTYTLTLPCPKATMYEQTTEGERVKDSVMIAIANALTTAYLGNTFTPLYGKIIQRA